MSEAVLSPNAWLRWDIVRRELTTLGGNGSILEVGMGQGALGTRLERRRRYVGVEPDDRSRSVARARLGQPGSEVYADVGELGPDERFDVVCAFEVLEHIDDDVGALATWTQHLRPGGHVLVSVPAHQHRFAEADELVGHLRRYSRADLQALLRAGGLEPVRVHAVGFPFGFALEWARNRLAARRLRRLRAGETPAERSARSGRTFQPPGWAGFLTQAGTAPFRAIQRAFVRTDLATGWVAVARRPDR